MKVDLKFIENEKHSKNKTTMENNTEPVTKANSIKHGWCQTINNTARYYQTLFIIAFILEQVSNYDIFLREQVKMEIAVHRRQNNMISEENIIKTRMSKTAKECAPNGLHDQNIDKDSKVANDDKCIQPEKCIPILYFF